MATKQQVLRLADKLGVEVDDESDRHDICIFLYTPKGRRFIATDCHTAATSFPSIAGTKAEGWNSAFEDLNYGVEDCDTPDCGYCERGMMNV